MSKNYFAIERNGECKSPVILADRNGNVAFAEFLEMSHEEMETSTLLEDFVVASMEAADRICGVEDDQTIVTLVGSDDVFIWSIIMGYENDDIRYCLVDWKKDGYSYRYES
jgi:hypothetical protein